jgi:hypothetical protein
MRRIGISWSDAHERATRTGRHRFDFDANADGRGVESSEGLVACPGDAK